VPRASHPDPRSLVLGMTPGAALSALFICTAPAPAWLLARRREAANRWQRF